MNSCGSRMRKLYSGGKKKKAEHKTPAAAAYSDDTMPQRVAAMITGMR